MKFKLNEDMMFGDRIVKAGSVVRVVRAAEEGVDFTDLENWLKSNYFMDVKISMSNKHEDKSTGRTTYDIFVTVKNEEDFREGIYSKLQPSLDIRVKDFSKGFLKEVDSTVVVDSDGYLSIVLILHFGLKGTGTLVALPLVNAFYNQGQWNYKKF